jgi:hypothetical protein
LTSKLVLKEFAPLHLTVTPAGRDKRDRNLDVNETFSGSQRSETFVGHHYGFNKKSQVNEMAVFAAETFKDSGQSGGATLADKETTLDIELGRQFEENKLQPPSNSFSF